MSLRTTTVILILTAALGVSACGDGGRPLATAPPTTEPLPTLPPVQEREPELFDGSGCLRTDAESSDCATRAEDLDAALAGTGEDDWRTLAGFVGSHWTTQPSASGITVLSETLTVAQDGPWGARGLIRNESSSEVTGLVVHARLLDSAGAPLDEVSTPVPVPGIRPGEPAPFQISSEVPAARVADVEWLTSIAAPADPSGESAGESSRDIELVNHWQRGLGDPRPVESYLYRDPVGVPHPYVAMGTAANVGGAQLSGIGVVAAFVDTSGRVLWVQEAAVVSVDAGTDLDALASPLVDPEGRPASGSFAAVAPGAAADFLVVVPAPGAPEALDDASVYLWGWGS